MKKKQRTVEFFKSYTDDVDRAEGKARGDIDYG